MASTENKLRESPGVETKPSSNNSHTNAILSMYENFVHQMQEYFPKVDQRLLLDIIKYQTSYEGWDGSILLKLVYPSANIDLESKKNWVFTRFNRVPSIEEGRTLRFKGIRIYLQVLEQTIEEDKDIEFITGSATLTSSDSYSA
jgi:hypothetical protein